VNDVGREHFRPSGCLNRSSRSQAVHLRNNGSEGLLRYQPRFPFSPLIEPNVSLRPFYAPWSPDIVSQDESRNSCWSESEVR